MDKLSYPKNKIKVVLFENIHENAAELFRTDGYTNLEVLKSALAGEELIEKIHDAYIVGIRSGTHISKEVLQKCTKLKVLGCYCIGTNQVDINEAMLQGIPVFNDPHSNTRSVAELVIGLCIVLMRDLFNKNAAAHAGQWKKISAGAHEIRGKTIGIVGYGRIGSQISILAEALGMHVFYYDIEQKLSLGNVKAVAKLEELLGLADIVTLHVPETKQTRNLIGLEQLKAMKPSAYLINTSRGQVVDPDALAEALKSKQIRGAAIDVFRKEPEDNKTPFKSPLQGLENIILTPHIGGATEEAQENIAQAVSQKLIYFINRGNTEGAVNFPNLALSPIENVHRILHIHRNVPGMLSQINKIFADRHINILGQYLRTTQEIGYVVFDIEKSYKDHIIDALKHIEGTISVRILY